MLVSNRSARSASLFFGDGLIGSSVYLSIASHGQCIEDVACNSAGDAMKLRWGKAFFVWLSQCG